jgi:hypothetical protein
MLRFILNEAKLAPMYFRLERLQNVITHAISGMSADDLTRHPEGKWCAGEILEHLYLTYTGTVKGFERCLSAGKPIATAPTLKQRLSAAVVIGLNYMPEGRKAPKNATPRGTPASKVLAEIIPQIAAMDDLIQRCEARYGKRTKLVDHPVLGPLTARQWRKFHWVHGQHHAKQILRLKEKRHTEGRRVGAGD